MNYFVPGFCYSIYVGAIHPYCCEYLSLFIFLLFVIPWSERVNPKDLIVITSRRSQVEFPDVYISKRDKDTDTKIPYKCGVYKAVL